MNNASTATPIHSMMNRRQEVLRFFAGISGHEFLIVTPSGSVVEFSVGPGQTLADELGRAYRVLESELDY
jgi:hypothetical protein